MQTGFTHNEGKGRTTPHDVAFGCRDFPSEDDRDIKGMIDRDMKPVWQQPYTFEVREFGNRHSNTSQMLPGGGSGC